MIKGHFWFNLWWIKNNFSQVYVLEENKHVRYILAGNALDIEREIETIAKSLSDASGLNIKVRMIEPNMDNMETMTNIYIYAIDPKTNSLVEMEELQEWVLKFNDSLLYFTF